MSVSSRVRTSLSFKDIQLMAEKRLGLEYAGTAIGSVILIGFIVIIALVVLGLGSFSSLSTPMFALLSFVIMMSAIQVFGVDVLKALSKYKNGSDSNSTVVIGGQELADQLDATDRRDGQDTEQHRNQ